jgi:hypothetical protein
MAAAGWEHADAYRVEVRGRLTDRFAASFDGLTIEPGSGSRAGTTVLAGPVRDQSHLMGILQTLDGLGIELISVNPDQPAADLEDRGTQFQGFVPERDVRAI